MRRATSVDDYISNANHWKEELTCLCDVLRATPLAEEIKWGAPCYTYRNKNIVGIGGFKSYFGLWFHQGALLKDEKKVLINAQEGKTKALRQWRMSSNKDVKPTIIKQYVAEAIALVDQGREIKATRGKSVDVPPELQKLLRRTKGATAAFRELRQGQQREYADYVASAKRDATKKSRVAKVLPMIQAGVGLNDKYRR
ncbi:MAG: YdeI/OmpD-associated family protein [Woeseiaceae bacterium]